MKIAVREKKLKNGKSSLYLDIYKGVDSDGNPIRKRKTLKGLFLYQNPKNSSERKHNKETKEFAEKVKIEKLNRFNHKEYGFNDERLDGDFLDYFQMLTDKRYESTGNYGSWDSALKHLKKFTENKKTITFKDVDYHFVLDFKNYLEKEAVKKNGDFLAKNSQVSYFGKFKAALKEALRARIINYNPASQVEGIKEEETIREYLDKEEIITLAKTPLKPKVLKDAFIFSCLTGLRFGDIQKLTWSQVETLDDNKRIKLRQQKTKRNQYIELHKEAIKLMGEQGVSELVFHRLKYDNRKIKTWVAKAGIDKDITFHCGRHTHATLLMTSGVDLYIIKDILGHKHIHTTQIYTKIVDERRKDAINKLPNFNEL